MPELNPNHPVTVALHDQWHTVCALIMRKLGVSHVVITESDLIDIEPGSLAVTVRESQDGLHIRIVSMEEGVALARKEGGLPV